MNKHKIKILVGVVVVVVVFSIFTFQIHSLIKRLRKKGQVHAKFIFDLFIRNRDSLKLNHCALLLFFFKYFKETLILVSILERETCRRIVSKKKQMIVCYDFKLRKYKIMKYIHWNTIILYIHKIKRLFFGWSFLFVPFLFGGMFLRREFLFNS